MRCNTLPFSGAVRLDYDQRAISCACDEQLSLPVSGVAQTRLNILFGQVREVLQNLLVRHPGCEIGEHIVDRDPHTANRWLPAAFTRLKRDDRLIGCIHAAAPRHRAAHPVFVDRTSVISAIVSHLILAFL